MGRKITVRGHRPSRDLPPFPPEAYAYLEDIARFPRLSSDEVRILLGKAKAGDHDAYTKLIEGILYIVPQVVRRMIYRGGDFMDLVQEGNIALLTAYNTYDPSYGVSFRSFAQKTVFAVCCKSIRHDCSDMRLPDYMLIRIAKVERSYERLAQKLGREPRREEIAQECNLSYRDIEMIELAMQKQNVRSLELSTETSYDVLRDDDEELSLADTILDENSFIEDEKRALSANIHEALGQLTIRERDVIIQRFFEGLTLEECSKVLGCTLQRVSLIETRAIRKLRHPSPIRRLLEEFY